MAVTAPDRAAVPSATGHGASPLALPTGARVEPLPAGRPPGTTLLGMKLLLAADAMVLVTMLVAYFTVKGGSPAWPAPGVKLSTYLPTVVTITVAMSAASVAWMVFAVRRNDQRNAFSAAVLTVILGLAIANAQWYSMVHAGFGPSKHAYATLYDLLIGFHLVHVVVGIVAVMVVAAQTVAGHYGRDDHDPVAAAALFWQFGNVTWLSVMTALFLLSRHAHK
ncbi:MAG: cytochrome c oxidase subunit 3 [Acidimicrobiales bacterium]